MKEIDIIKSMVKPDLELDNEKLPEIKNWKVGSSYKLELTVEMRELEKEEDGKFCAEFMIKKIKSI